MADQPSKHKGQSGIGAVPMGREQVPMMDAFETGEPVKTTRKADYRIDMGAAHIKKQYDIFGGDAGINRGLTEEVARNLVHIRSERASQLQPIGGRVIPAVLRSVPLAHISGIREVRLGNPESSAMWDTSFLKDILRRPKDVLTEHHVQAVFKRESEEGWLPKGYSAVDHVYSAGNGTIYIHDSPYDESTADEHVEGFRKAQLADNAKLMGEHFEALAANRMERWTLGAQAAMDNEFSRSGNLEKANKKRLDYIEARRADLLTSLLDYSINTSGAAQATLRGIGAHVYTKLADSNKINVHFIHKEATMAQLPSAMSAEGGTKFFSECYQLYVTRPNSLKNTNIAMYEFLRDTVFFGQEYAQDPSDGTLANFLTLLDFPESVKRRFSDTVQRQLREMEKRRDASAGDEGVAEA